MMKYVKIVIARSKRLFGVEVYNTSRAEKWVSVLGCSIGIFLVYSISYLFAGPDVAMLLAPSMGAAAILVFVVPHAALSQPWAVLGGNVVAAAIGVTCYKLFPNPFLAAALAMGFAVIAMHLLVCMHPPAGASALIAVVGGPGIHDLGYGYVFFPVFVNVFVILVVAIIFNSLFPWRRYPASYMQFTDVPDVSSNDFVPRIDKKYIESAVKEMDMLIDLTSDDLQRLVTLILEKAELQYLQPKQIKLGHFYTNGEHGGEWSIRQIIDESACEDAKNDMVVYRTVEGSGLRSADSCTRRQFAQWAVREVFPTESNVEKN
ncbi:MAG: HPP family protein [Thiohalomonadales bacterium]